MEYKAAQREAEDEAQLEKERQAFAESRARIALEAPAGAVARTEEDENTDAANYVDGQGTADHAEPGDSENDQDAYQLE